MTESDARWGRRGAGSGGVGQAQHGSAWQGRVRWGGVGYMFS